MLIGIAFVVDELNKGQRLICRYPEAVPSSVLNSGEEMLDFHKEYLSLSPDNFAKLFRPKSTMFNKILELTIDDITYISYPTPCTEELSTSLDSSTVANVITLFNVVIAIVRPSAIRRIQKTEKYPQQLYDPIFDRPGFDPVSAVLGLTKQQQLTDISIIRKVVASFSRALLHQEKLHRYVSRQVSLMLSILEGTFPGVRSHHRNQSDGGEGPGSGGGCVSLSLGLGYSTNQISNSVSGDMPLVVADEHSVSTTMSLNATGAASGISGSTASGAHPHQQQLELFTTARLQYIDQVMQYSSLANELREVYHGLLGGVAVNLLVNNSLIISIPLNSSLESKDDSNNMNSRNSNYNNKMRDGNSNGNNGEEDCRTLSLNPTDTLLLISDTLTVLTALKSILVALPWITASELDVNSRSSSNNNNDLEAEVQCDKRGHSRQKEIETRRAELEAYVSPKILDVILAANPLQSFIEIGAFLELNLEELAIIVQHLCLWRLGKVIRTVTMLSLYQLHPRAPLGKSSRIYRSFSYQFPGFDLYDILKLFNGKSSLEKIIELLPLHLRKFSVDITIWLLRHSMIRECCQVLIELPAATATDTSKYQSQNNNNNNNNNSNNSNNSNNQYKYNITSTPSTTSMEKDATEARNSSLHPSLYKYFDGLTVLEDILWDEQTTEEIIKNIVTNDVGIIGAIFPKK